MFWDGQRKQDAGYHSHRLPGEVKKVYSQYRF